MLVCGKVSQENFVDLAAALLLLLLTKFISATIIKLSEFLLPHFAHLILCDRHLSGQISKNFASLFVQPDEEPLAENKYLTATATGR